MPDEAITRVNALCKTEIQPPLLTFYDRRSLLIGDLTNPNKIKPEDPNFDKYDKEADDGLEPLMVNKDFGQDEDAPQLHPLPPISMPQQKHRIPFWHPHF